MLLSDYLGIGTLLDDCGVFDLVLNKDSHFFINIQRLKKTAVPEFVGSYDRFRERFRQIIKLLEKAEKKDEKDIFFRQALRLFNFSEVNEIRLGYAKGNHGAGFGKLLARQVIETAFDIVKAGVEDPEFFELLPLFQEKVAADRLSDMIATLILDDIKAYTKRINTELSITKRRYRRLTFNGPYLVNPYEEYDVFLVPVDILHKLPVAESWSEISCVATENSTIRAEINAEVAVEWSGYKDSEKKKYLRQYVFYDPEVCERILKDYRLAELQEFNPKDDFDYFLGKLLQGIRDTQTEYVVRQKPIDTFGASLEIIDFFKHWIEDQKGWEVIWNTESKNREKVLQRVFHLHGQSFTKANKLAMSCEPDEGRGPVDFKVSSGEDITLIEVKLSTNNQYLHGYEVQLPEYGKAEETDNLIYVLIDLGHPQKMERVKKNRDKQYNDGKNPPELIIIDGTTKLPASRYNIAKENRKGRTQ